MDDRPKDARSVFVRNIGYQVDEETLQTAFEDVGPVRKCFIVKDKDEKKHRGFGFVEFALPEDAERAISELQGKEVGGRKLKVETATRRAPLEERKKRKAEGPTTAAATSKAVAAAAAAADAAATPAAPQVAEGADRPPKKQKKAEPSAPQQQLKPQRPQQHRPQAGPNAKHSGTGGKHGLVHAVAIGNLTPQLVEPALAFAKTLGQVDEVVSPAPEKDVKAAFLPQDGCTGTVVFVYYNTVRDAMEAVAKLHNCPFGPAGPLSKKQEKSEGAAAGKLWARQVSGEGAHVKKWRIILRNLPFSVTEKQLQQLLEVCGFIWDLKLPRSPDGKVKGFAFASFTSRAHAEKAIAEVNQKLLGGRMVVADWAVAKTVYQQQQGAEEGAKVEMPAAG